MLNINNKKRLIVSAFVAVAVILPAAIFAVGNLVRSNNSFAASAAAEASGFEDDKLWYCVVYSYKNIGKTEGNYVRPSESDFNTALDATQLGNIKNFMCTEWIATDTTDWTGLDQLKGVVKATFGAQANMTSFEPNRYFNNLEELYLYNDANLTTLDLAGATKLKQLHVVPANGSTGNLESIQNLSAATSLVRLNANSAKLSSINLSSLSSLEEINLAGNQLTSVTLPSTCKLKALNVRDNASLSSFGGNLNSCTNLLSIAVIGDNFNNIDVSGITGLKALKAADNPVTVVDISNNKQLVNLQLDSRDYAIVDVDPVVNNEGKLVYNYSQYSFIGAQDHDSSHGWNGSYNALINSYSGGNYTFDPDNLKYMIVNNYENLPTVSGANSTYNGNYKYVDVKQQAPAVQDTNTVNANYWDLVNNNYRLILEKASTNRYTLSFDSRGGSSVQSQSCSDVASCEVTIPDVTPTLTNYAFRGWATTPTGEPEYWPGDDVTLNSDKTLYAVWDEMALLVLNFDSQGGSSVQSQSCRAVLSCKVTIPDVTPAFSGHTFKGWATTPTGKPTYQPGNQVTLLVSSSTLYAIWEENAPAQQKFTITYNANGGSGAPAQGSCEGATSCTAPISTGKPMRTGYTFLGWSTNQNATTPDANYAGGKTVTLSSNITLYAVWKQNPAEETPFKISYSANGGTNAPDDSECTGVGSCTTQVSPDLPERDGYTFLGWSTDPSATEPNTDYAPGKAVEISDNIILYAVWQANTPDDNGNFTLTFDPQGGTAVSPKSCDKPGTCVVTIPDAPTRDNYSFEGWATTPDGKPEYQPNDAITLDGNKTLYAIWKNVDNGGTDGEHGIGTPNTGEATDGGEGASAVYIIAGVLLAMAAPTYFGIRSYKKSKFIKR